MPAPSSIHLSSRRYAHPAVIVVIRGAGDDVAEGMNAHIPQRGEGQGKDLGGDLLTQQAHVGWVGDTVVVAVEVAMVVSTYLA
jgi:hypothetical protein